MYCLVTNLVSLINKDFKRNEYYKISWKNIQHLPLNNVMKTKFIKSKTSKKYSGIFSLTRINNFEKKIDKVE